MKEGMEEGIAMISEGCHVAGHGDAALMARLRSLLELHDYPIEGRAGVHIGFESEQTVQRESRGNFWHHWK